MTNRLSESFGLRGTRTYDGTGQQTLSLSRRLQAAGPTSAPLAETRVSCSVKLGQAPDAIIVIASGQGQVGEVEGSRAGVASCPALRRTVVRKPHPTAVVMACHLSRKRSIERISRHPCDLWVALGLGRFWR